VLSNIFLHYVLDDWYVREVQPRMKGRSFLIRFADDFITGFELESDARKALEAMRKRFDRYGLELHPDKTKLLRFARPGKKNDQTKKSGTFDFLGFTFYLGMSRRGYWVIMKKTASKRLFRCSLQKGNSFFLMTELYKAFVLSAKAIVFWDSKYWFI